MLLRRGAVGVARPEAASSNSFVALLPQMGGAMAGDVLSARAET